mgnify:CR=1 FL=1
MTVKFNVVERANPGNREAPPKYYPSIVSSGRLTLRQLAGRIAQISTVSSADTMAVLEAFLSIIPDELAKGHVVELGEFGNFWLKRNAEGAETPEAVRASQINTLLPRFIPGKEFKKVLGAIDFEKA